MLKKLISVFLIFVNFVSFSMQDFNVGGESSSASRDYAFDDEADIDLYCSSDYEDESDESDDLDELSLKKNEKGKEKTKGYKKEEIPELNYAAHKEVIPTFRPTDPTDDSNELTGELPEEVIQLIDRMNHPKRYRLPRMAEKMFKVVLIGPPGVGKSTMAKLIAAKTHREYYNIMCSEFVNQYQASSAKAIQQLFDQVKQRRKPAVIFIDEIDGIANKSLNDNNGEFKRAVYQIHKEVDQGDSNICCIVATNHYDELPDPFKQRFDLVVDIPLPDFSKRCAIFKFLTKDMPREFDNSYFSELAELTSDFSCRVLEKICRNAFYLSKQLRGRKAKLKIEDFILAICSEQNNNMTLNQRRIILDYFLALKNRVTGHEIELEEDEKDEFERLAEDLNAAQLKQVIDKAYDLGLKRIAFATKVNPYSYSNRTFADNLEYKDLLCSLFFIKPNLLEDARNRELFFKFLLSNLNNKVTKKMIRICGHETNVLIDANRIFQMVKNARDIAFNRGSDIIWDWDLYIALYETIKTIKNEEDFEGINYEQIKYPEDVSYSLTNALIIETLLKRRIKYSPKEIIHLSVLEYYLKKYKPRIRPRVPREFLLEISKDYKNEKTCFFVKLVKAAKGLAEKDSRSVNPNHFNRVLMSFQLICDKLKKTCSDHAKITYYSYFVANLPKEINFIANSIIESNITLDSAIQLAKNEINEILSGINFDRELDFFIAKLRNKFIQSGYVLNNVLYIRESIMREIINKQELKILLNFVTYLKRN